jgi:purine-nucleoside phosphorylase
MSTHIGAAAGQIAPDVLLPGDPLRAEWIAQTYLDDAQCYSRVRGMLGFTGTYCGEPVSVQGTGMGMPSLSIYVTELIEDYGARTLLRVGSCGSMQADLGLLDVVIATSASTDSAMNRVRFRGIDFAPTADFSLLRTAHDVAVQRGVDVRVGPTASWDAFYPADPTLLMQLAAYGVLAVEMETAALYTIAAGAGVRALTICQVSDSLVTNEHTPAEQRERGLATAAELALETVHAMATMGGVT